MNLKRLVSLVMKQHLNRVKVLAFRHQIDVKQSLLMALVLVCCARYIKIKSHIINLSSKFRISSHKSILLCVYLESGSQSSCVSSVDSSVSVEVPECAWLGVGGKVVLSNRRHVHRRSKKMKSDIFSLFGLFPFIL